MKNKYKIMCNVCHTRAFKVIRTKTLRILLNERVAMIENQGYVVTTKMLNNIKEMIDLKARYHDYVCPHCGHYFSGIDGMREYIKTIVPMTY